LKQFSNKRARRLKTKNFKTNKKPEDKRTNKEERKELKSKKDFDLIFYALFKSDKFIDIRIYK
jgi:hypothetical protein